MSANGQEAFAIYLQLGQEHCSVALACVSFRSVKLDLEFCALPQSDFCSFLKPSYSKDSEPSTLLHVTFCV